MSESRLPRFTLRDLFWLVLVAALSCAWWKAASERDRFQDDYGYYRSILLTLVSQPHSDVRVDESGVLWTETPHGVVGFHLPAELHPEMP